MPLSCNCLPEGVALEDLIRRNCAIGFDLRFCRNDVVAPDETSIITCDPGEAEFATLYALTELGEALAIMMSISAAQGPTRWPLSPARSSWPSSMPAATRPMPPGATRRNRQR